MAYKTINPYTNEVEKEFPNATDEELEAVLAKAHQLYLDWRNDSESLEDRKAILHRVADILRERRTEYATIMSHDMGKLIGEAEGEVDLCADICDCLI